MAICNHCGKKTEGEGIAFCPYCGERLGFPNALQGEAEEAPVNPEAAKWIERALKEKTIQKRKKVLEEAKSIFQDDRSIDWELLFIGKPQKKRRDGDFFIIKSYLLQFYRSPVDFPEAQRMNMRRELFEGPELKQYLEKEQNPQRVMEDYLLRICTEYIEIFLEGDNRVNGSIFGFRLERAKEKTVARPAAEMIRRMERDEQLSPEQRKELPEAMYRAFSDRYAGKTQYLDELLG